MLKKNKEFNVFHHVWSHLTTSPNACLSSPSDPRCVQPRYRSEGGKDEERQARAINTRGTRYEDNGLSCVISGCPGPSPKKEENT